MAGQASVETIVAFRFAKATGDLAEAARSAFPRSALTLPVASVVRLLSLFLVFVCVCVKGSVLIINVEGGFPVWSNARAGMFSERIVASGCSCGWVKEPQGWASVASGVRLLGRISLETPL